MEIVASAMSPELQENTKNPVITETTATTMNGLVEKNPKATTNRKARINATFNKLKGFVLSIRRPIRSIEDRPRLMHAKAMLNCCTVAPLFLSRVGDHAIRNHVMKKIKMKSAQIIMVEKARPSMKRCFTGTPGSFFSVE